VGTERTEGQCFVCGEFGPLSDEHVPPKRAFNDRPFVTLSFNKGLQLGPEGMPEGPKRQGGVRFPSLCKQCNNDFGGWYARAFVEWCYQGMYILERSGGAPQLVYAHHIFPLRVVKQIAAMFMSVNGKDFRLTKFGKDLVPLLKKKEAKGLPEGLRLYAYFNIQGQLRYTGRVGKYSIAKRESVVFSEITYPPFGYVMALSGKPPDDRMFDITHFAWNDYDEQRSMFLDLPVLPTYLATIPGDYRELDEIYRDEQRNLETASCQENGLA
jgi:hypothetical protein